MVWLGDISFAFYLWHRLVTSEIHRLLGGGSWATPVAVAALLGMSAVTVLLSWALLRFVERPAMRHWSRPRLRSSGASAPVPI
jgi:peptidoglycan/LPS O-acetylase OafA/YrhL